MTSYHHLSKEFFNLIQTALFNIKREGFIFTLKSFPYYLKMRILENQENFDKKFGMDTSETALAQDSDPIGFHVQNASAYAPTMPCQFIEIINSLTIVYNDFTFIDLGSGKGRVLFLAANYPFKKIIGVEFCKKLHEIALHNIDLYTINTHKDKNHFELHLMDAANYLFPPGNLFIYLFNPFDEKVFSTIIENIKKVRDEKSRKIIIAYIHPLFNQEIENAGFTLLLEKKPSHFLYNWKIYSNNKSI